MSPRHDIAWLLGGRVPFLVNGKLLHLFILLLPLSHVCFLNLLLGSKLFETEDYLLFYTCTVKGKEELHSFWKIIKATSLFRNTLLTLKFNSISVLPSYKVDLGPNKKSYKIFILF